VSLQSKHRTPPCPRSEFSQQPTVSLSSRNPSSASTLEVFFFPSPVIDSTIPLSRRNLSHPSRVNSNWPINNYSQWELWRSDCFPAQSPPKSPNPPPLSNKYSKSSAPQQSPLQQPERQLLSIETAAIGLFFGSASTKTPPLPTHSSESTKLRSQSSPPIESDLGIWKPKLKSPSSQPIESDLLRSQSSPPIESDFGIWKPKT
jgi:hypothetical protein